jgi:AcrR family transcriptional regulator
LAILEHKCSTVNDLVELDRLDLNIYVQISVTAVQTRIHDAALRLFAEKGSTQLSVSELADAAGLARGTIYNHFGSLEALFEKVAAAVVFEMQQRLSTLLSAVDEPATQLALSMRATVRRAHDEPQWGRFINRFGVSEPTLQMILNGPLMDNLQLGITNGRYDLDVAQIPAAGAHIGGSLLAAMLLVLEGHRTWRAASSDVAELSLRALGLPRAEAQRLAALDLPPLPPARSA